MNKLFKVEGRLHFPIYSGDHYVIPKYFYGNEIHS